MVQDRHAGAMVDLGAVWQQIGLAVPCAAAKILLRVLIVPGTIIARVHSPEVFMSGCADGKIQNDVDPGTVSGRMELFDQLPELLVRRRPAHEPPGAPRVHREAQAVCAQRGVPLGGGVA